MKFPENFGYKVYFIIFGWLCFGDLGTLLTPDSDPFIYYHTLKAFYPPAEIFHSLAIVRVFVNLVCLIPLFNYAFDKEQGWKWALKPLFVLRIVTDVTGHNYEWQVLKALFHTSPLLPVATIGIWAGTSFISYKAHFLYAFRKYTPPSVPKKQRG